MCLKSRTNVEALDFRSYDFRLLRLIAVAVASFALPAGGEASSFFAVDDGMELRTAPAFCAVGH